MKEKETKIGRISLHILIDISSIIVIILLAFYLSVPSYQFEDPAAFHGDFIHNPYQKMNSSTWKYIDFRGDSIDRQGIPVYEYGFGFSPSKYLCIGYKEKRKIDYPFFQNIHYKQYNINCLQEESRFAVPAHPFKGFKMRMMKHLDRYRLMEVMSPLGNSFDYWDLALSCGHRVNIIGTGEKDGMKFKTVVNGNSNDKELIYKSLEAGDFYAISFPIGDVILPELRNCFMSNDTIFVSASQSIDTVKFIGQNGVKKKVEVNKNQSYYVFEKDDSYIRTEMVFLDGTTIYLNPIVRHQFQYFYDPVTTTVMQGRTWLMRIVYVITVFAYVKYLFSKRKEKIYK